LLSSVQIAIVIVASDLRIRRFTPMAERTLNLIPGDVGRPIGHIKPNIDCADLEELVTQVIDTVTPCEREVRDAFGHGFSLCIRANKHLDSRMVGTVLALFVAYSAKRREDVQRRASASVTALIETAHEPMLLLGSDLRVRGLNRAFAEMFGVSATEAEGRPLH